MTTIDENSASRRRRHAVATLLVAAGATIAGGLVAPAIAHADDTYIAVSLGYLNNGTTVVGGKAVAATQDQARIGSLNDCVNNGGTHCVTEAAATNGCAAAVTDLNGDLNGASGATLQEAESNAMSKLAGARVVVSGCSSPQTRPILPPIGPVKPPAPKPGPTVSWNLIVGGFVAHITDRSGVSSQCTYVSEELNRSFGLPANSTYDLKVVPAIPQFRDWTVTITCDNGTSTTATHHF